MNDGAQIDSNNHIDPCPSSLLSQCFREYLVHKGNTGRYGASWIEEEDLRFAFGTRSTDCKFPLDVSPPSNLLLSLFGTARRSFGEEMAQNQTRRNDIVSENALFVEVGLLY